MRRFQIAVPREKEKVEPQLALAVPGIPLLDSEPKRLAQRRLALRSEASILQCEVGVGWAIKKELVARGMNARIAGTGRDCLAAIRVTPFDLVFLGFQLPDVNGIDILKSIRNTSPETRVVVISGDGNILGKERALAEGAVQFLEKPFDIGVVAKIVDSAFGDYSCKRRNWRYLCDIPLRLSVLAPSRDEAQFDLGNLSVRATDVGCEGIRVRTQYPLKEGQDVRIKIYDESDPFLKMIPHDSVAEVVWAVPGDEISTAGLTFVAETTRSP